MFTFPLTLFAGLPTATRTFVSPAQNSTASTNTFTFSSTSIGTADATRYIVVAAFGAEVTTSTSFNGITIGGNAATTHRTDKGILTPNIAVVITAVAGLAVAAGTTATIVVTFSAAVNRCGIGVYALYNLGSTTPFASNGAGTAANSTTISTTLNIPSAGIAVLSTGSNINEALTITGLTEDFDQTILSAQQGGASAQTMTPETGRALSSSSATARTRSISAVSWA